MATITTMSSSGHVVIPGDVRKSLKLKAGDQFVVIGREDAVMLKAISPPSSEEFTGTLNRSREAARAAGSRNRRH